MALGGVLALALGILAMWLAWTGRVGGHGKALAVLSFVLVAAAGSLIASSIHGLLATSGLRRFLRLADSLKEGVALVSGDRRLAWVNRAFCEFLHLEREQIIGRSPADFLDEGNRAALAEQFVRRDAGEFIGYELEITRHDGDRRTVHITPSPLLSSRGKLEGTVAIFSDITASKNAARALEESETRYRQLVDSANEGVAVVQEGRFVLANRKLASLGGYELDELMERDPLELVHPVDRGRVEAHHRSRVRGEAGHDVHEFRALAKNGDVIWLRHSVVRIEWHGKPATLNLYADVTRDRLHEQALAKRERRSRALYEDTPAMLLSADSSGAILGVSNLFLDKLGYVRSDVLKRSLREILVTESQTVLDATIGPELLRHGRCANVACRMKKKDGTSLPVRISAVLDRDAGGEPQGMLAVLEDTTEPEELERQLRRAQRLEALGTLAGGIAHDFNNILFAILGYADMAVEETPEGSRCRNDLEEIRRAAARATDLVEQIVSFARRGQQELRPLEPGPVVKESLRLLRATLPTSVALNFSINGAERRVLASPAALQQLVTGLCATLNQRLGGQGTIDVVLEPRTLSESDVAAGSALTPGSYVAISVRSSRHTMCGESAGPLRPLASMSESSFESCESVVRELGGVLVVSEACDVVCSVDVLLHVCHTTNEPPVSLPRMTGDDASAQGGRVIVVDDEAPLVSMLCSMLRSLGLNATGFTDPRAALDAFAQDPNSVSLVVTDQTMPQMTGAQFAERVLAIRPGTPLILCSGYSESLTPRRSPRSEPRAT
ncbi:MAG: PAS domain S-box protein [Acidobacteria bacterium]|nr:PAS domain S-box protein [Acidobacteriota bacterium]